MRLYHFTCDHHVAEIRASGELRPALHPVLSQRLLWLTPFPNAKASELGLTRTRLKCDRMAHRFEVETSEAVPWSTVRGDFTEQEAQMLEAARGAKPDFWYVARTVLPISDVSEKGDR